MYEWVRDDVHVMKRFGSRARGPDGTAVAGNPDKDQRVFLNNSSTCTSLMVVIFLVDT